LVGISGEITDKYDTFEENMVTSFTWYEIGNAQSNDDLYQCGLIESAGE
jgi:hypothetical protein